MAETDLTDLWAKYQNFLRSSIGRSRSAVRQIRRGTYSAEKSWNDWAACWIDAVEVTMRPYELVFRESKSPLLHLTPSKRDAMPLFATLEVEDPGAGNIQLLFMKPGDHEEEIKPQVGLATDRRTLVIVVPTLEHATIDFEYQWEVRIAGKGKIADILLEAGD